MRIAFGADHRGFALKEELKVALAATGHEIVDVGASELDTSDDYPDYAYPAAMLVSTGEAERAVLVCGSGTGMAIVANKVPGIRAVEGSSADHVCAARRDDDVNVLALSADELTVSDAREIAAAFFEEPYAAGDRHDRRLDEIADIERDDRDISSHE
jgi:ribose 5-phosphate isomerase B